MPYLCSLENNADLHYFSGPTGTVKLAFQSEFMRFTDLADRSFT